MTVIAHPGFLRRLDQDVVFLRRYARALTGSQEIGDRLASDIRSGISNDVVIPNTKVALFQRFHDRWPVLRPRSKSQELPPLSREVVLLHSLEDFTLVQVAEILRLPFGIVHRLFDEGLVELGRMRPSRILLIEEETLIAMDMSNAITDMGHTIVGVARTRAEAVSLAKNAEPELILSDIQLADDSSGIEAIGDILEIDPTIAVIFVTDTPESLLTGILPEPAFVINKPYRERQVMGAISQALALREADHAT
jgi:CheY-like chemotaxis protein